MPATPGTAELRNDGSPDEKDRLLQHYGVRMADERIEIAGATRPARRGIAGTEPDSEVRTYLGPVSIEDPALRHVLGHGGLAMMGLAVGLLFAGMPVPFLVGLASVSAVDWLTRSLVRDPATRPAAIQINILISIVATLTVSAVGGLVVLPGMALFGGGALMLQQARRMTLRAVTDAAATFNTQLKARIDDATVHEPPPGGPATPPPTPETPPDATVVP